MAEDKKTVEKVGKIFQQIPLIMADIKAIGKDQTNVGQGKFKYRGIDDVYNELQQHLAKHKVFSVPKVLHQEQGTWKTSGGANMNHRALTVEYTFYAEDGSSVSAVVMGEAMDTGDKACSKALAIAHKYVLFQVFCIPTDDAGKDPDQESHQATRQNGGGGHPPGSLDHARARQQEEKDNAQGGRPAIPVTMTVNKQDIEIDYYEVLRMFQSAKAEIIKLAGEKEGKSAYYDVLGNHGYEKSNLIPKGKMNEVFQDLKPKYKELKEELEERKAAEKEAEKDKDKPKDKKEDKKADPPKESKDKDKDKTEEKKPPYHMEGGPKDDDEIPF